MLVKINNNYQIKILDNNHNKKTLSLFKDDKDFIDSININSFIHNINERYDKIKIVKGIKYNKLMIYEYKIVLNQNTNLRVGFSIDVKQEIIYIILITKIDNDKLRKHDFDQLVYKCVYIKLE